MGSVRVRVWLLCAAALVGVYLCSSGLLRLNEVFTQAVPASSPPSVSATTTKSDADDAPRAATHKRYDRLVVVLIDALRADMVLGSDVMYGRQSTPTAAGDGGVLSVRGDELNAHMPYTRALVASGDALGYIGYASVPTVTMPRLKALVTGKAPAFIDILKNFNSAALSEENLVELLAENGHRIVFYGDDTWLKLFPSAFERSDGTSGFFTRDTVEVDDNVTRHLQDELDPTMQSAKSLDWDVLVLHYLGLDHVGHLRGPRSPMMVDKLHEMDEIVKRVHKSVKVQDALRLAQNPSALPSLVLLCSDHGMSEVGNHGGATVEESSALMLFLRGDGKKMRSSQSEKYTQRRKQVDLVPTIASLFGLRIPPYSTGLLLDEVIQAAGADGMSTTSTASSQYLRALYQNFQQLYGLAVIKFHKASLVDFDASYGATAEKIRVYLENSTEDQEVDAEFDADLVVEIREACGVLQDKLAQSDGSEYNAGMALVGLCFLFCSAEVAVRMLWGSSSLNRATPFKSGPVTIVLVLGSVLQVVSLTSSSSIENEHATSFYLLTTVLCAFGFKIVSSSSSNSSSSKAKSTQWSSMVLLTLVLITTRVLRSRNQVINFGRLNGIKVDTQQYGNEFATDDSLSILSTGPLFNGTIPSEAFFVLICGLVGSKALLLYTKKAIARHPLALLGLSLSSLSFSIGMLCSLLCSRMARLESQGSEHQEQEDHSNNNALSKLMLQVMTQLSADDYARIVYASVAFLVAQLTVNRVARLLVAEMVVWLLVTLLQRESNLPTLGCLCVQLFCLSLLLKNQRNRKYQDLSNGVALGLLGLWLAQSAFFALGNSHLVTTIDISQSFHGLSGYTQWIVGLLTFVSVFSGPLVVFVNLLQWVHNVAILDHHSGDGKDDDDDASVSISTATNGSSTVHDVCLALFAYQTLRFAMYTIVVYFMRFHLFIWSVFAPKVPNRLTFHARSLLRFTFSQMLYEVTQTSVVLVLVVIVSTLPHGTEIDKKPKRT